MKLYPLNDIRSYPVWISAGVVVSAAGLYLVLTGLVALREEMTPL